MLQWAAASGYLRVVEHLLAIQEVPAQAAADNNDALCCAAKEGLLSVIEGLLTITPVRHNCAAAFNAIEEIHYRYFLESRASAMHHFYLGLQNNLLRAILHTYPFIFSTGNFEQEARNFINIRQHLVLI